MSQVSEAISRHHRRLQDELRKLVDNVLAGGTARERAAGELTAFLQGELLDHATGEEKHLYPAVDPLVATHARATDTMRIDHEFIHDYIKKIADAAKAATAADPGAGSGGAGVASERLRDLILKFEAIFEMHLEKEERVYLPLFGKHLTEEEQKRVLDRMHEKPETAAGGGAGGKVVDVRDLPPGRRHPLIFAALNDLAPGESFVLVNDHDPRPLYYQMQAEQVGGFTWHYLEEGPEVWRVTIGKER